MAREVVTEDLLEVFDLAKASQFEKPTRYQFKVI
jgi:hypothetical protein